MQKTFRLIGSSFVTDPVRFDPKLSPELAAYYSPPNVNILGTETILLIPAADLDSYAVLARATGAKVFIETESEILNSMRYSAMGDPIR